MGLSLINFTKAIVQGKWFIKWKKETHWNTNSSNNARFWVERLSVGLLVLCSQYHFGIFLEMDHFLQQVCGNCFCVVHPLFRITSLTHIMQRKEWLSSYYKDIFVNKNKLWCTKSALCLRSAVFWIQVNMRLPDFTITSGNYSRPTHYQIHSHKLFYSIVENWLAVLLLTETPHQIIITSGLGWYHIVCSYFLLRIFFINRNKV